MTTPTQRIQILTWLHEAVVAGARRAQCAHIIAIDIRTLERWQKAKQHGITHDARTTRQRPPPLNKLSALEKEAVLNTCNLPKFSSLPPSQIVPKLADEGIYLASESTFYRILSAANQLKHRGRARARKPSKPPATYIATRPNQVWTWDITYLPSKVKGQHFYLYMIQDLYSRYGVGFEVHQAEQGNHAAALIERTIIRSNSQLNPPVLHSDNGSVMKCQTMRVKLTELGIESSFSRPRVSDDNAFIESFFRTLKYCPQWPLDGFETLDDARKWVGLFMIWYNTQHLHSSIKFVTPAQRYNGEDTAVLVHRAAVYAAAKLANPNRWRGAIRNWHNVAEVALNPEKPTPKKLGVAT